MAAATTVVMAVPAFGQSQEKASSSPKASTETVDSKSQDPYASESYTTRDGLHRHYHNPKSLVLTSKGEQMVSYALGATESPYESLQEIRDRTPVPQRLEETDFFSNYINAKANETNDIDTDLVTGNRYYDYEKTSPWMKDGVAYQGDNHWNVLRFLIRPHFEDFNTTKDRATTNATYDMYRYFLYQDKGDREAAWQHTVDFMSHEVDPIVNGKWTAWHTQTVNRLYGNTLDRKADSTHFIETSDIFDSNNEERSGFIEQLLTYNKNVADGKISGMPFSRQEVENALTDYNIEFRKKDPETARAISQAAITKKENWISQQINRIQQKPLSEYKVIQEGNYPAEFDRWDPIMQDDWEVKNPEKVRIVQEGYTEQDRQKQLAIFEGLSFAK